MLIQKELTYLETSQPEDQAVLQPDRKDQVLPDAKIFQMFFLNRLQSKAFCNLFIVLIVMFFIQYNTLELRL